MLNTLHEVLRVLPTLIADAAGWQSLDVSYHPPRVERLWRQYGPHRIYLHRIYPCAPAEALFHPHPWPSAMRIVSGTYEMALGSGAGREPPPVAATVMMVPGSEYEMVEPDGWHAVRPIGNPALSVMVTGAPWDRPAPKSTAPLSPLEETAKRSLLDEFQTHFPSP